MKFITIAVLKQPPQRVMRDKLETAIARKILDGTIQKGTEFELAVDKLE